MKYLYYPGCSLESQAQAYGLSLKTVFRLLGHDLQEIEDWNCCGATAYMSVKETVAFSISARNLALAERIGGEVVAPCSSCFTILNKTKRYLKSDPGLRELVNQALRSGGLEYAGSTPVRHPLEVLINDIGLETIKAKRRRDLKDLRIAPYYGCQLVRPERGFDNVEVPMSMDHLFGQLGGELVHFPVKVRCCGGMLMSTFPEVGLKLNKDILECASENQAEVIITTCPMCHINLEAYQKQINRKYGTNFRIPIWYFTQLLGWSLGADKEELGLKYNFVNIPEEKLSFQAVTV